MPRLRKVAGMCSSKVAEMRICGYRAEEKILCRSPISQRSHVGNLRQTLQGKGEIHKRVETAGVYPLVRPRGVSALPAEVQRKTLRPLGTNTLTQFAHPAQPVQEKAPPVGGEPACGSSCAPVSRCRKRSRPLGRTRLHSSHTPQGSAEKFQQRLLTNLYVCIIIIIQ